MNATKIRAILNEEAVRLFNISGHHVAANSLAQFATTATDAELIRFRQIISGLSPAELNDAARGQ